MKASHSKTSKHKPVNVKLEKVEGKQVQIPCREEHDLTYYVKDRVELMKQIFSILKDRELLAMAPDCLRDMKLDELQEALLDEVLGISSKRLHSILDGYDCPSNTDSSEESSTEALETISLDSISSDDEILSHQDQKSKKKHAKKKCKTNKLTKKKGKNSQNVKNSNVKGKKSKKESNTNESQTLEDGSGNGMTVLELLELQARARAIRAQLAAVEVKDNKTQEIEEKDDSDSSESDEDEVVIKEEPPDIVEIPSSSDETEKDSSDKLNKNAGHRKSNEPVPIQPNNRSSPAKASAESSTATSSNNTQNPPPRKIKLNRTNLLVSVANNSKSVTSASSSLPKSASENVLNKVAQSRNSPTIDQSDLELLEKIKNNNSCAAKPVIQRKPIVRERRESEADELTLELSDSEKMYLLEGFQSPKSYTGNVGTNDIVLDQEMNKDSENKSLDSTNASENNDLDDTKKLKRKYKINNKNLRKRVKLKDDITQKNTDSSNNLNESENISKSENISDEGIILDENVELFQNSLDDEMNKIANKSDGECSYSSNEETSKDNPEIFCISDDELPNVGNKTSVEINDENKNDLSSDSEKVPPNEKTCENIQPTNDNQNECSNDNLNGQNEDIQCPMEISESEPIIKSDNSNNIEQTEMVVNNHETGNTFDRVLEISDNSEDDISNVFSKEPTREEIEELSRKIDFEIERENLDILGDPTIDLKIKDNEKTPESENPTDETAEGISWKARWLKSNKVQRVLATSNLCNALRKKNIELKKKLENNAKMVVQIEEKPPPSPIEEPCIVEEKSNCLEIEGSVSQYEKLTGSTKYVDPIQEPKVDEKAMATDAKQLMKMYKKLLKIHSLDEDIDGSKKKSKKNKKDKKRDKKEKKKNKTKDATPPESVSADLSNNDAKEQQSENVEESSKVSE